MSKNGKGDGEDALDWMLSLMVDRPDLFVGPSSLLLNLPAPAGESDQNTQVTQPSARASLPSQIPQIPQPPSHQPSTLFVPNFSVQSNPSSQPVPKIQPTQTALRRVPRRYQFFRSGLVPKGFEPNENAIPGNKVYDRFFDAVSQLTKEAKLEIVFHGTHESNVPIILVEGLDPNLRKGQAHGPGEYFSTDPVKSHSYCKGGKKMLVFIVIKSVPPATTSHSTFSSVPNHVVVVPTTEHQLPIGVLNFISYSPNGWTGSPEFSHMMEQLNQRLQSALKRTTESIKLKILEMISGGPEIIEASEKYYRFPNALSEDDKQEISTRLHQFYEKGLIQYYFQDIPPPFADTPDSGIKSTDVPKSIFPSNDCQLSAQTIEIEVKEVIETLKVHFQFAFDSSNDEPDGNEVNLEGISQGGSMTSQKKSPVAPRDIVRDILPSDVLLDFGTHLHQHPGNQRLKTVINETKHRYADARRMDRNEIINSVIRQIQGTGPRPRRFLRRESIGANAQWRLARHNEVYRSVSSALRKSIADSPARTESSLIVQDGMTFADTPGFMPRRNNINAYFTPANTVEPSTRQGNESKSYWKNIPRAFQHIAGSHQMK